LVQIIEQFFFFGQSSNNF